MYLCGKRKVMAQIVSQPAATCFSSAIGELVFSTNAEEGTLVLDLICNGTRMNLLEETLYPDMDSTVRVTDVESMVEPYVKRYLEVSMECTFTDTAGSVSITPVTVLYAMADVDTTASSFLQNHFLSILDGEKMTAAGREERIHAYGANALAVTADVKLANGEYDTLTATLTAMDHDGSVYHFDVSPDNIISLLALTDQQLLAYTVTADLRTQRFRMVEEKTIPAPSLMFINSFGYEEFIHCVGTHKKDSKYDRKATRVKGKLRSYQITEDRQFSANTGWLNEAMADWADDLFRSDSVFLWIDGTVGREVVLNDSKSEITNEDDFMPAFEFTYTYAQRIHNVMQSGRVGRIFDNTFDHTFN